MQLKPEQEQLWAVLQHAYAQVVSATGLKPREVARRLLEGSVRCVVAPDMAACQIETRPDHYTVVTFGQPVPNAAILRTFKYRSPNNVALVDEQGQWTGVVAYFREWHGFIGAAVEHVNLCIAHDANL